MGKISRFLAFCTLLAFLAPSVHAKRNFLEVVDDTVIASKLRFSYMKDDLVDAQDINIKVLAGVVTLEGYVASQDQINRAIELAEKQKGVGEVKAYLVLREFGRLKTEKDSKRRGFFNIFRNTGHKTKKSNKEDLQERDLGSTGQDSDDAVAVPDTQKTTKTATVPPDVQNDIEPVDREVVKPLKSADVPSEEPVNPGKSATTDDGDEFKEFDGY